MASILLKKGIKLLIGWKNRFLSGWRNIDKIRKIIYKTIQIIPNPYIYLGNIVSYSKYDDEDLKSIEEQHLKNNMK